jgi:hypothetical protein
MGGQKKAPRFTVEEIVRADVCARARVPARAREKIGFVRRERKAEKKAPAEAFLIMVWGYLYKQQFPCYFVGNG